MSRSGYTDDFGDDFQNQMELYRHSVESALKGRRGQAFLTKLRDALDAMPSKRLIRDRLRQGGDVCAFGSLTLPDSVLAKDAHRAEWEDFEWEDDIIAALSSHFNIAPCVVREVVYMNDEGSFRVETPEGRWTRMRAWCVEHIRGASDGVSGR